MTSHSNGVNPLSSPSISTNSSAYYTNVSGDKRKKKEKKLGVKKIT
jgi:hypothetical protein